MLSQRLNTLVYETKALWQSQRDSDQQRQEEVIQMDKNREMQTHPMIKHQSQTYDSH